MTRKIVTFCFIILCIFAIGLIAGCREKTETSPTPSHIPETPKPTLSATIETNITKTEGQFNDTNPPSMEGPVVALDEESITLKILGREYKITLSERAKEEIKIYRDKIGTPVEIGSYMQIPYKKTDDGGYIAYNLRFVKSN